MNDYLTDPGLNLGFEGLCGICDRCLGSSVVLWGNQTNLGLYSGFVRLMR